MKLEHVIVQQLYKSKKVTLQGIGTFRLDSSVAIPPENEKDYVIPENAISFEYNLKATEDEALIEHIVAQTRKMKSLASSDLESYCMSSKQFLNIGKPLIKKASREIMHLCPVLLSLLKLTIRLNN